MAARFVRFSHPFARRFASTSEHAVEFKTLKIPSNIRTHISKMRIEKPTPIQKNAIPAILAHNDVLVHSPTGSGKTLAYMLPIVSTIDNYKPHLQGIVVVPTKELAVQIGMLTRSLTGGGSKERKDNPIIVRRMTGTLDRLKLCRLESDPPHLIIATPKILQDMITQDVISVKKVRYLVLDEVDHLVRDFSLPSINFILKHMKSHAPTRQVVFVSATCDERTLRIARTFFRSHKALHVSESGQVEMKGLANPKTSFPPTLFHSFLRVSEDGKPAFITKYLGANHGEKQRPDRVLCFVNDRNTIVSLLKHLESKKIRFDYIFGDCTKEERNKARLRLETKKIQILISTEMVSRGLDLRGLTHVINYDLPKSSIDYVHRAGRVARIKPQKTAIKIEETPNDIEEPTEIETESQNIEESQPQYTPGTVVTFCNDFEIEKLKSYIKELNIDMKQVILEKGIASVIDFISEDSISNSISK